MSQLWSFIGSCGVCHNSSRREGTGGEFAEAHTGSNPEARNVCHVCHTPISANTALLPHAYSWKNSNQTLSNIGSLVPL